MAELVREWIWFPLCCATSQVHKRDASSSSKSSFQSTFISLLWLSSSHNDVASKTTFSHVALQFLFSLDYGFYLQGFVYTGIRNEFLRKNMRLAQLWTFIKSCPVWIAEQMPQEVHYLRWWAKIALQFEFQMERCTVIKQETDNPILFKLFFFTFTAKISWQVYELNWGDMRICKIFFWLDALYVNCEIV